MHGKITKQSHNEGFWFPGRWVGGTSLVLAPLLLLMGVLLRQPFHFFFPDQLAAFKENPNLMTASYSLFIAGNILMWPSVITLSTMIGSKRPVWAVWGGIFAIFGLFARTFHAGVDHLAFQLVHIQNLDQAAKAVADSYSAFHIFSTFNAAILLGWIVLAIGAYRSGTLGLIGSIALGLMSTLPLGVLKGTTSFSIIAAAGLCVALVPLGWRVLRDGPIPCWRQALGWIVLIVAATALFYFFGRLG